MFPQAVYCWGSILERKELATLTGRAPELCGWALWLSVAGLCGWALSSSCPPLGRAPQLCQLCGWALWLGSVAGPCPPLVLLLAAPLNSVNSVAVSSSCPACPPLVLLLAAPLVSVAGPCPPLVLLLAAPLNSVNSVAGLCVQALALSSSTLWWPLWLGFVSRPCPPLGRAPELSQWLGSVSRPCPPLVFLLPTPGSVAGPCPPGLLGSCPPLVLCAGLCGWALSSSCPPLVLVLAPLLNSVAGLCGPAYWRGGVWPNK